MRDSIPDVDILRRTLDARAGGELLNRLLYWLVTCVANRDIHLVIRKLCAALVAVFKQTEGSWTRCVKHVVICFLSNSVVDYAAVLAHSDVALPLFSLSQQTVLAGLRFGLTLFEEISQLNLESAQK